MSRFSRSISRELPSLPFLSSACHFEMMACCFISSL